MEDRKLVTIPWKDRLCQSTGIHPVFEDSGYLVLFPDGLAWRPKPTAFDLPFMYPSQYYVKPLSAIHEVKFERVTSIGSKVLDIVWDGQNPEPNHFEIEVVSPHSWLAKFRELGVPVVCAERLDPKTFRGFLNNYWGGIWVGLILCTAIAIMVLSDAHDVLRNLTILSVVVIIVTTFGVVFIIWWRSSGSSD